MALFEPILAELDESGVRFVVVGGLAVILHGYTRATADMDLVVDLSSDSPRRAVDALSRLGLSPVLPVDAASFADVELREAWTREKGMQVFTMADPGDPFRSVDLLVNEPHPFGELYDRSVRVPLRSVSVRIASIPDLIAMKRRADRPQDRLDIEALEAIQARLRRPGG